MSEPRRPTDAPSHSSAHADTVERIADDFVDTAHLRNVVQARLFGASIEPVRIGRFPILRTIGKGAMGAVYAAYDNQLDRKIALKLLHAGGSADDDARRGRMLREAKALARLSHPGVVHVYEVGEHEGRVYLAMEFVEGADVRKWSRAAERSVGEVLEIFAQAGRGLAAAHAAGLVHRDVKPDNIVVGTDGRACMIDFGLAVEHDDATHSPDADDAEPQPLPLDRWTQTRGIVGTPAYMAAEQLAGADADARSDQFGFAVALFETLYGQRPFSGATLPALAEAIARGRLDVPAGRRVPAHVLAALKRALAAKPDDRFADMDALLDALAHAPKRRLRWRVVLGVSGLTLAGLFAAVNTFGLGEMVEANMAAYERSREADARRDDAMVAELLATVERDPSATITRLTELRTSAPAWSTTVWSLAQTIADVGVASDIVELDSGAYYTRFAGPRRVQGEDGDGTVWLDYETGESVGEYESARSPDGAWRVHQARGVIHVSPPDGGQPRRLHDGYCDPHVRTEDGTQVAATCRGKTHVWNLSTNRERATVTDGKLVHVDRDGAHVLTRTDDAAWQRWDLLDPGAASAAVVAKGELRAYDEANGRAFVAEGGVLATVDLVRGTVTQSTIAAEIVAAAAAPDGRTLAIGTHAGELWWLDLADADAKPQRGRDALGDSITKLAWAPSGGSLLAVSSKGTARVFDSAGRAARMTVRDPDPIHDARWIDDALFETLSSTSVRRWAIAGPRVLGRGVAGVATCDYHKTIVGLVSGEITRDGVPIGNVEGLRSVAASPDCRTIAAIGERSIAIVGDTRTIETSTFVEDIAIADETLVWRERCELHILPLAFGAPHTIAAAPGRCFDGVAILGDAVITAEGPVDARGESFRSFALADGRERTPIDPDFAIGPFAAVPETGELAIASDQGVVLFDPKTSSSRTLGLSGEIVLEVATSDDGEWIAAQPFRGRLRIWHVPTGSEYAAPITPSTVSAESLRAWMVGPLHATGSAAFTFVDFDRTAFTVELTVPTDGVGLRRWVGEHLPRRRQVPRRG